MEGPISLIVHSLITGAWRRTILWLNMNLTVNLIQQDALFFLMEGSSKKWLRKETNQPAWEKAFIVLAAARDHRQAKLQ